jgi:hypothetical protein
VKDLLARAEAADVEEDARYGDAIEGQDDLSPGVVHAAHPQDLSSMAVLQPQTVIHDSSPLLAYALRKQLFTITIYDFISGPPAGSKPFAERIWQLVSPGSRANRRKPGHGVHAKDCFGRLIPINPQRCDDSPKRLIAFRRWAP